MPLCPQGFGVSPPGWGSCCRKGREGKGKEEGEGGGKEEEMVPCPALMPKK